MRHSVLHIPDEALNSWKYCTFKCHGLTFAQWLNTHHCTVLLHQGSRQGHQPMERLKMNAVSHCRTICYPSASEKRFFSAPRSVREDVATFDRLHPHNHTLEKRLLVLLFSRMWNHVRKSIPSLKTPSGEFCLHRIPDLMKTAHRPGNFLGLN